MSSNKAHWEKGERVWGYWLGEKQLARISLSPKLPNQNIFYTLDIDVMQCNSMPFDNLQKAKKCAERVLIDFTNDTRDTRR